MTAKSDRPIDYRRDIDGLRAIAVLAVILFHIDGRILPGGFVGVDVFFVISGYLISLHIFNEINAGRFSLAEFYRRRIKRIAPAMLVVVAVTLLLTQFLFIPDDAEVAAEAAFFSLFSAANVYFWKFLDASYFAPSVDQQPFLHLWSLAVEEQFYFIWPLVLLLVYRQLAAKGLFLPVALTVAALSFALGDIIYPVDSRFAYYMLPTRAGELLLGAIVAHLAVTSSGKAPDSRYASVGSVIGLLLVLGSCIWTSESQPFPGWRALPPTVGTALVIHYGSKGRGLANWVLENRLFVWVGAVSYSAYLWHWPILSIPRYFGVTFDVILGTAAFIATFTLAWLSYRFVEQPARRSRKPFLALAWRQYVAPAGALGIACVLIKFSDGYGVRAFIPAVHERLAAAEKQTQPAYEADYVCQKYLLTAADFERPKCVIGPATAGVEPETLLWGDSNASHYVGMLDRIAESQGYAFRNIAASGCPPVLEGVEDVVNARKRNDCGRSAALVRSRIDQYKVVWIAADWLTYQQKLPGFLPAFEKTLRGLVASGKQVVVIGKAPVIAGYDRKCAQKQLIVPSLECRYEPVPLSPDVERINTMIRSMVEQVGGAQYFDANAYLCPQGICRVRDEAGSLLYVDEHHLSIDASHRLGTLIIAAGVPAQFRRDSIDRMGLAEAVSSQ